MTIFQTPYAEGRMPPPLPFSAGMVASVVYTKTLTAAYVTATDIIELGAIPATARIVGATLICEGMTAATTADVGVMDGAAGDAKDTGRALTADLLFDGVDAEDTETDAALLTCLGIAPAETHRGIGVTMSANEAAGAGKKITVRLDYVY